MDKISRSAPGGGHADDQPEHRLCGGHGTGYDPVREDCGRRVKPGGEGGTYRDRE